MSEEEEGYIDNDDIFSSDEGSVCITYDYKPENEGTYSYKPEIICDEGKYCVTYLHKFEKKVPDEGTFNYYPKKAADTPTILSFQANIPKYWPSSEDEKPPYIPVNESHMDGECFNDNADVPSEFDDDDVILKESQRILALESLSGAFFGKGGVIRRFFRRMFSCFTSRVE
jgi:hypothetical protein